jgi:signal transduction histidine kinase
LAENTPRPAKRGDDALDRLAAMAERWRTASAREITADLADLVAELPGIAAVRVVVPDPTAPIEESRPPGASRELVRVDDIGPIELWIARRGRRSEDAVVRMALAQAGLAIEAAGLRGRLEGIGRTRDEFVAAFGHELRDRLAPIFTSLTLLKMGEGRPEAHRQVIERQVTQLAHLVNDLIDVSHMARGELRLKHAPVDLASALNGAIELATPLLGDRTTLSVRVDRGQLHAMGDRQRLAQMLAILLVRSARPGGTSEVAVEGRRAGDSVELRLRGAGGLASEGVDAERTGFSSPPRSACRWSTAWSGCTAGP